MWIVYVFYGGFLVDLHFISRWSKERLVAGSWNGELLNSIRGKSKSFHV